MTILLTGSDGFIGTNVLRQLVRENRDVTTFNLRIGEVYNEESENELLNTVPWPKITGIIHLGAETSTIETYTPLFTENNIKCTLKLMARANTLGIPMVYASSASVYGNMTDGSINPLNQYAMSKAWVDNVLMSKKGEMKTRVVGLRYFNVYSETENKRDSSRSLVNRFIADARAGRPIRVFTNNRYEPVGSRDFIHVSNVVSVTLDALLSGEYETGVYDVGTGFDTKIFDIAKDVSRKWNVPIQLEIMPSSLEKQYQFKTQASVGMEVSRSLRDEKLWNVRSFITSLT